jgi:hypothetical protein
MRVELVSGRLDPQERLRRQGFIDLHRPTLTPEGIGAAAACGAEFAPDEYPAVGAR